MRIGNKTTNLGRSGLANMARNTNVLRNINLSGGMSGSYSPMGVCLNSMVTAASIEDEFHFKVEQATNNSVEVHAGSWERRYGQEDYRIELTIDGGGTSELYDDVVTITNAAPTYIVLTLDNYNPSSLTAGALADIPVYNPNYTYMVIAYCNGSGDISEVEQFWSGGNIKDKWTIPDTHLPTSTQRSIEYNQTAGCDQVYNFGNATNTYAATVYLDPALGGDKVVNWVLTSTVPSDVSSGAANAGTYLSGLSRGDHVHHYDPYPEDFCDEVQACLEAAGEWFCDLVSACFDCSWISECTIYHYNLDFASAMSSGVGGCNDDHSHLYPEQGAAYDDASGAVFFQSIGRGDTPICNAGGATSKAIDITSSLLVDTGGVTRIDWQNRFNAGDDWTFNSGCNVIILDNTDSTNSGTGSLTTVGGIGCGQDINIYKNCNVGANAYVTGEVRADDFIIADAAATNYWNAEDLLVTTSSAIDLNSPNIRIESETNDITLLSSADVAITTMDDMDLTLGADLTIDGDTGWSGTFWVNNGTQQITVTKGWVVTPAP